MQDVRDMQLLQETLARYNFLINRPFLQELMCAPVCPPCMTDSVIRLIMIKALPSSHTTSTFEFILNALASLEQSIGYLLDFSTRTFYIGLRGDCSFALSMLQNGLMASFPGIEMMEVCKSSEVLGGFFNPARYTQLAAVTVIPNSLLATALMTSFTTLMGNTPYMAFFLASPFSYNELLDYHAELCETYGLLSTFSQANANRSTGLSKNSATTIVQGDTITRSNSSTQTIGTNSTKSTAGYTNSTISSTGAVPALNNQNATLTYLLNKAKGFNEGNSSSNAEGNTYSRACINNTSRLSAENRTSNESIGFSIQNKCVQNALSNLSNIIDRIDTLLQSFSFEYSAYFFSAAPEAAVRAAYSFLGLAPNNNTYLGASAVNLFNPEQPNYETIYNSLIQFEHPKFILPNSSNPVTNTTFISGSELLNSFYLPIS